MNPLVAIPLPLGAPAAPVIGEPTCAGASVPVPALGSPLVVLAVLLLAVAVGLVAARRRSPAREASDG